VATFIVQKVLLDDVGLSYICATAERFYAVSTVLCNMVSSLAECPPARLLKHVIRCYLRLTDNDRAREALKQCLPDALKYAGRTKAVTAWSEGARRRETSEAIGRGGAE
ncbi:cell differentiation protein Rcd1, partial [Toxoplasma gondii VAND]